MRAVIEKVAENLTLGEGPHWDIKTQSLYYVDLLQNNIHKYTPSTNEHGRVSMEERVSVIIPVEETADQFVITHGTNVLRIAWDGSSSTVDILETIATADLGLNDVNCFNDGKADSMGNFWAGTMAKKVDLESYLPRNGSLYSVNTKKELKSHFSGISISNGLAWSHDNNYLYYIDSGSKTIDRFNFDINSGTISNREIWFSVEKHNIPGIPDGQTIDTDGNLWVAIFGGSRVIKIDGKNKETLLDTLNMPQAQVASVTFGGTNLDELYVTTASIALDWNRIPSETGALYRVKGIGAKAFPAFDIKF